MRRLSSLFLTVILVAASVAIGVTAYNAGYNHGLDQAAHATQVVRYVGPGFGFFPFGFLLFPLLFFAFFRLAGRRRWRRWNGHDHNGRGHFEERFDEWHRSRHEDQRGPGATV